MSAADINERMERPAPGSPGGISCTSPPKRKPPASLPGGPASSMTPPAPSVHHRIPNRVHDFIRHKRTHSPDAPHSRGGRHHRIRHGDDVGDGAVMSHARPAHRNPGARGHGTPRGSRARRLTHPDRPDGAGQPHQSPGRDAFLAELAATRARRDRMARSVCRAVRGDRLGTVLGAVLVLTLWASVLVLALGAVGR